MFNQLEHPSKGELLGAPRIYPTSNLLSTAGLQSNLDNLPETKGTPNIYRRTLFLELKYINNLLLELIQSYSTLENKIFTLTIICCKV